MIFMYLQLTLTTFHSQVYVVCKSFSPIKWLDAVLEKLTDYYGEFPVETSLFSQDEVPESFLSEVRNCGELFMQLQENVISNNLHYWNDQLSNNDMKDLAEIQTQVGWLKKCQAFCRQYLITSSCLGQVTYNFVDTYCLILGCSSSWVKGDCN